MIDTSCKAFRQISFSGKNDTAETVKQIREHNAVWQELCE